jgi:hypothetical protein
VKQEVENGIMTTTKQAKDILKLIWVKAFERHLRALKDGAEASRNNRVTTRSRMAAENKSFSYLLSMKLISAANSIPFTH